MFVFSFVRQPHDVPLGGVAYTDALRGHGVAGRLPLPAYGMRVLTGRR